MFININYLYDSIIIQKKTNEKLLGSLFLMLIKTRNESKQGVKLK